MRTTDGIALVAIAGGLWANVLTSLDHPVQKSRRVVEHEQRAAVRRDRGQVYGAAVSQQTARP